MTQCSGAFVRHGTACRMGYLRQSAGGHRLGTAARQVTVVLAQGKQAGRVHLCRRDEVDQEPAQRRPGFSARFSCSPLEAGCVDENRGATGSATAAMPKVGRWVSPSLPMMSNRSGRMHLATTLEPNSFPAWPRGLFIETPFWTPTRIGFDGSPPRHRGAGSCGRARPPDRSQPTLRRRQRPAARLPPPTGGRQVPGQVRRTIPQQVRRAGDEAAESRKRGSGRRRRMRLTSSGSLRGIQEPRSKAGSPQSQP